MKEAVARPSQVHATDEKAVRSPRKEVQQTSRRSSSKDGDAAGATVNSARGTISSFGSNAEIRVAVAAFLETVEVQTGMIFLIALDVGSALLATHLVNRGEVTRLVAMLAKQATASSRATSPLDVNATIEATSTLTRIVLRLLDSFAGFTIVCFLLELMVLAITFRARFFAHAGYVMDTVVVIVAIAAELSTQSKVIRLCGLLRVWRVFRLVNTLLEREQAQHDATRDALNVERARYLQSDLDKRATEDSLKREHEARASTERMLQGYKDEVDTLREALNIAAQTVAEVALQNDGLESILGSDDDEKEAISQRMALSSGEPVGTSKLPESQSNQSFKAVLEEDNGEVADSETPQDGVERDGEEFYDTVSAE